MAIEIVDLPIKHGDFPVRYVNVYQRVYLSNSLHSHSPTTGYVQYVPPKIHL